MRVRLRMDKERLLLMLEKAMEHEVVRLPDDVTEVQTSIFRIEGPYADRREVVGSEDDFELELEWEA